MTNEDSNKVWNAAWNDARSHFSERIQVLEMQLGMGRIDANQQREMAGAMRNQASSLFQALDGLLIALSPGKGIAEATDNAKEAMCLTTQGDTP